MLTWSDRGSRLDVLTISGLTQSKKKKQFWSYRGRKKKRGHLGGVYTEVEPNMEVDYSPLKMQEQLKKYLISITRERSKQ